MKLEIDVKQALIVTGGITAGMVIGFGLSNLMLKKAKKELRAEVIDKETKAIKNEITKDIKENIDIKEIKNDIKEQLKDSIVEDTLKEMTDKTASFMAKVEIRLDNYKDTLKKYEKTLRKIESDVLDTDARVGKLVNGALRTVAGVVINRGDEDDED